MPIITASSDERPESEQVAGPLSAVGVDPVSRWTNNERTPSAVAAREPPPRMERRRLVRCETHPPAGGKARGSDSPDSLPLSRHRIQRSGAVIPPSNTTSGPSALPLARIFHTSHQTPKACSRRQHAHAARTAASRRRRLPGVCNIRLVRNHTVGNRGARPPWPPP